MAAIAAPSKSQAQAVQYLEQGWDQNDRQYFYRTTQGSRLVPYDIYMALEVANGNSKFSSPANLRSMQFVYDASTAEHPIGFVKDETGGRDAAFGFTCAACHTREVSFGSTRFRIDGAQGQGDMERFLHELEASLGQTLSDSNKFRRMRDALGYNYFTAYKLRTRLDDVYAKIQKENSSNAPGHGTGENNPGPGRLDAFAHIKNRVADYVYEDGYLDPSLNNVDATAPVSYPFLWDAPYLDYVQWPSTVPNWGPGSLGRNVGEVLGVFAETTVTRNFWGTVEVTSSANLDNLLTIEEHLLRLKSPQWPAAFPAIDQELAALGDPLFDQYCGSCHGSIDRDVRTGHIDTYAIGADLLGTDPTMADNTINDLAPKGKTGPSYQAEDLINPNDILGDLVLKVMSPVLTLGLTLELTVSHKQPLVTAARNTQLASGEDSSHTYKARPLNGIWATAPYLHNGSVRTLDDIMKPGPEREASFCVGTTEYDPAAGGFVGDCSATGNSYQFDTSKQGNSRLGHEYGFGSDTRYPHLTELERQAIVEYMKSL